MHYFNSEILENIEIASGFYKMSFRWPNAAEQPLPGQFITIRSSAATDPLLRRPLAFSGFTPPPVSSNAGGIAEIIYERRGKVTQTLASAEPGDSFTVLGPLGNAFPQPDEASYPILIAGGVGLGPIFYLAVELAHHGFDGTYISGARTSEKLARLSPASPDGRMSTIFCTDDGSFGARGTVINQLESLFADVRSAGVGSRSAAKSDARLENAVIYACGPEPMLEAVHNFAVRNELPCWVSMEQVMGCAVGACMGCVIRVHGEKQYARVCTEGPVFDSRMVVW